MHPFQSTRIRKVLVCGANGVQGGAIVRRLHDEGFDVRGAVRDLVKAASLSAAGIPLLRTELDDREGLRHTMRDVEALVLTIPLEWNRETVLSWARNVASAALAAGVRLLVVNSSTRIPAEVSEVPVFELRRESEALLREFGPPCIVLRPPLFMENLAAPWIAGAIARDRVLPYPVAAEVRVSWLAATDLGGYVASALRRADLAGRTFDVGGPEALDGPALAHALSRVASASIRYLAVAPADVARQLTPQLGAAVAHGIARNYAWLAERSDTALFTGTSQELARDLRRAPLSVTEWARTQPWASAPTPIVSDSTRSER